MIQHKTLDHSFVDSFPDTLAPGILYVSFEYGSAAHSCCCGCGEEVVTPLTPTDWNITYDGETITLHPSVGSWTLLDCAPIFNCLRMPTPRPAAGRPQDCWTS